MKASVKIVLADKAGVLTVPRGAVFTRDGQSYCLLVRDGKVVETKVTVGLETDGDAEIVSGLTPDDLVITGGVTSLKNGQSVVVAADPAKS